jgi:ATP-dependent RNA helicase DDX51/DBP6
MGHSDGASPPSSRQKTKRRRRDDDEEECAAGEEDAEVKPATREGDGEEGLEGPEKRPMSSSETPTPHKKKTRAEAALPWMRVPLDIPADGDVDLAELSGLNPRVRGALEADGFDKIFAVQAATWRHTGGGMNFDRDLCVCAPTGSGKTLAYALPIVQALAGRTNVRRLRALVVVPTGDLASQVAEVFAPLCKAAGLRVGVAQGPNWNSGGASRGRGSGRGGCPQSSSDGHPRITHAVDTDDDTAPASLRDVPALESHVDLLVTPPGRLVAHIRETPGFSLSNLEFLVVDEADRILRQSYQGWLPLVIAGAGARPPRVAVGERGHSVRRLHKLLVSATLTRDPARLVGLHLHAPRMLTAVTATTAGDARYLLPDRLEEHVIVAEGDDKPLALCALLSRLGRIPVIVFTASVDATHRLYLLLESIGGLPSKPVEYSSFAPQSRRAAALGSFRSGSHLLLIASDAATRGLDVDGVGAVISYDAPSHLKTYVHRVGRTARAGRRGMAYTLCRPSEENKFQTMLAKVDGQRTRQPPGKLTLGADELKAFALKLRPALASVKLSLEAGEAGKWSGGVKEMKDGETIVTAAARVAADQASRNFRSRFFV